jgi:trimeric autotransporter adhesin
VGGAAGDLTTGNNDIMIGNIGATAESNVIRIGTQATVIDEFGVTHAVHLSTFIAGIRGTPITGGMAVGVSPSGQLGVRPSSARYKEAIQPMDKASEAILALKPVTFRYKKEIDPAGVPEFGLVAEEVEKVNPDLVARDAKGKVFTVRYDAVNAMLLNEFLKARRQIDAQQKQLDALTAGLQKVSAQLELAKPAPQTVRNSR